MKKTFVVTAAVALCLWACGPKKRVQPRHSDTPLNYAKKDEAKIILLGDTGVDNQAIADMRQTLLKEEKDLVVILGDLVYPNGPRCPDGDASGIPERIMDSVLGKSFIGLGAPVLLALGNHDIGNRMGRNPASEACFLDYAAKHDDLVMPSLNYMVDLGVGLIAVTNTNAPSDIPMKEIQAAFEEHPGWTIFAGHHVLRTYHDKVREDYMLPILRKHKVKPDLYTNGHAHFLQFGVYESIPAATIGAGAKLRVRPECPPDCGPGQSWGASKQGYGLLHLTPHTMTLTFKDRFGDTLWRWSRNKDAIQTDGAHE